MLLKLILATIPVGVVLLSSEYLWRRKIVKGERARKFIPILAGVWMAFWPFYIPFDGIFIMGCFSLVLLIYSRYTNLFHAIYAVKRRTYGELFFAMAIIVCSYLGKEPWIFTTSILLLALADGGAAVVGRFWGITNQYFVLGYKNLRKSKAGSAAFLILAYISIAIGVIVGGHEIANDHALLFVLLPVVLTVIENMSPYGLDNIITPVLATLIFNSLV